MLNFGDGSIVNGGGGSGSSSSSSPSSSVYDYSSASRRRSSTSSSSSNSSTSNTNSRLNCSQQSVLSAIDRFVKAVNNMDATVLVPSRLQDMEVQNRRKSNVPPPGLHNQDLYSFYSVLKDVKNELLWGPSVAPTLFPVVSSLSGMSSPRRLPMTSQLRQLSYRPQSSDDGLGSSTASDQDTDSDFESIVTDRDSTIMEQTSHLANAFRHHLNGLHAILHQLADSADYLSARYQEEIELPIM